MWTHKCKVYNNVVDIEADRPYYWCGLTQETAEQLSNEHINENKQFLQEINEHGQ